MRLGNCLLSFSAGEQDYRAATAVFSGCIMKRPDHALPYIARGVAFARMNRFEEALADLTKAIELDSSDEFAWFNRGSIFVEAGQLDKALADYSRVIELAPEFASGWYNRGVAHTRLSQFQKAIEDYSRAIDLDSKDAHAWINRGAAYGRIGRLDLAIADYFRALELNPEHHFTTLNLSSAAPAYQKDGKATDAIRLLKQLQEQLLKKLSPDHPNALTAQHTLAAVYWSAKQFNSSIPLFEDTLRRRTKVLGEDDCGTIETAFFLGVSYRDAGRMDDALRIFDYWLARGAKVLKPDDKVREFGRLGAFRVYSLAGRHDRAESLAREAAEQAKLKDGADSTSYAGCLAELGVNLLQQRKWTDAESVFARVWESAKRKSRTTGGHSMSCRSSAARSWAGRSTMPPRSSYSRASRE